MLRRVIGVLALFGMLVHVGLVVRHHGLMTAGALAAAASPATASAATLATGGLDGDAPLVRPGIVICHTGLDGSPAADLPGTPGKTGKTHCPLCVTATMAGLASEMPALTTPEPPRPLAHALFRDQRYDTQRKLRPPARAPPLEIA